MKYTFNTDEWFVWEQSASPMLLVMTLNPSMRELRQYLGSPLFTTLIVFETVKTETGENYQGKWALRTDEGRQLGQKMIDMLSCPPYRVAFETGLDTAEAILRKKAEEVQFSTDLSEYDNRRLIALFEEFCQVYYDFYKFGAFVEPIQWQTEHILRAYLKKAGKDLTTAMPALLTFEEESFLTEIQQHLSQCAKALGTFLKAYPDLLQTLMILQSSLSQSDFAKQAADLILSATSPDGEALKTLKDRLERHSRSYYWKKNDYLSTIYFTARDVLIQLLMPVIYKTNKDSKTTAKKVNLLDPARDYELLLAKSKKRRTDLLNEKASIMQDFSPYYRDIVAIHNSVGGLLSDRRKRLVMVANAAFDRILGEVSSRTNTSISDIRLLIPQELGDFLTTPDEYIDRFVERRNLFLVFQSDFPMVDELLGVMGVYSEKDVRSWHLQPMIDPFLAEGEKVERTLELLDPRFNLFTDVDPNFEWLQGFTAYIDLSQPEFVGTVRVIRNAKVESLQPGEILVATSTTPDYMDQINKCRAIVTDLGGMTSHAAQISNTLSKPCIIGTNFGAQVLKSGDTVRLDFVHGTIQVLKRKRTETNEN